MGKKKYDENDEIELRLTHDIADHYFLEWRFKEPKKVWFFWKHDRWKTIQYYSPGVFSAEMDPNDDTYWYWHGFHLGNKAEVQEYENLKKNIRTKKQLFDYYNVQANIDTYYRNLHTHKQWLDDTKETIKRLVD